MKDTAPAVKMLSLFALLASPLAAIAALSPAPWWPTDRDIYLRVGEEWLIPGCTDFHCFRVLVPWVIERFPGDAMLRWKVYAVLCQAGAGVVMAQLVTALGARERAARQVAWMTALGSGALYTLFDPHSGDPLMHVLAPLAMLALVRNRLASAGIATVAGVFAKEFVVVPAVVVGLTRAQQYRLREAARVLAIAAGATVVWMAWQLTLRWGLGYTSGATRSAEFGLGSYLSFWLLEISPSLALASVALSLGALWIVWPAGVLWGSRELRQMTFAAVPTILIFSAVQQPDRALWNFAFLVLPAAAVVLERVPPALGWGLVVMQVLANLRVGAQLPFVPPAAVSLAAAGLIALASVAWVAMRRERAASSELGVAG